MNDNGRTGTFSSDLKGRSAGRQGVGKRASASARSAGRKLTGVVPVPETFSKSNGRSPAGPKSEDAKVIEEPAFVLAEASATSEVRIEAEQSDAVPAEINENWLSRNGHTFTYAGIFLFTLVLYFRPYELIPSLSGFQSIALIAALVTLLIYLPTQLTVEGNLTALPLEIKCIFLMTLMAAVSIPIAKSPGMAWDTFTDSFIKVVLIFVVMVNTLRTGPRIKALMWLGIGVGIMLSWQAVDLYQRGEFKTDGYRVSIDFGGMFGNPNDMSIHLVIFVPIAIALGAASRNWIVKLFSFASAGIMTAGIFVAQSRGAFLGLVAVAAVLVWKFGRRQRIKTMLVAASVGLATILLAPGNYGLRILSIFIPSLDPVGSSDQRTELLLRSILVSLRNPLGIGIGNFEIVGSQNHGTHNAFTQVSAELGIVALAAYLVLLLSPVRKLDIMERQLYAERDFSWLYYLSIGVQASIAGYCVSSFFSSVAYNWYVYYPIAYAIGLRRIYQLDREAKSPPVGSWAFARPEARQA